MRANSLTGVLQASNKKPPVAQDGPISRSCAFRYHKHARLGSPHPQLQDAIGPFGVYCKVLTFKRENFIFPCRYAASGHIQS
jgi:hypothetical protein